MQKLLTFFSKNNSIYAIFNDQSFNDTLTNDIFIFEQLGPAKQTGLLFFRYLSERCFLLGFTLHEYILF